MMLINHIVTIDIGNGVKLIINALNGLMDKVDANIIEIITKWQRCEEIVPTNESETELLENLRLRGYLINSREEEVARKNEILDQLRQNHAKTKDNNKNLTFIMTYDCNFRCPYCFEGVAGQSVANNGQVSASNSKTAVLTPDMIDAALKLTGEKLQNITLFGGEPLLPKNRSAIEYIISKAPNLTYQIITNGYYLEELIDLFSTVNVARVMVTLDGEEDAHNSRRYLPNNKPTYKKIMIGIEKCLNNAIPVCIRMNLDDSNFDSGNSLKVKLLERFTHYSDLLSFEISPMLWIPEDELNKTFSDLYSADINYTYEERKQRNRLLSSFNPIVNAITAGAKMKPVYSYCYLNSRLNYNYTLP